MRRFSDQSMMRRRMALLGTAVAFVLLALSAIAVYSYIFTTGQISAKYLDASRKTILQTTRNLDTMLEKMEAVSLQIVNDPDLKGHAFDKSQYAKMNDKLFKFTESIHEIRQIMMFPVSDAMSTAERIEAAAKSDLDSKNRGTIFLEPLTREWIRSIAAAKGAPVWFPTVRSGFSGLSFLSDKRFFMGRVVTSPKETNLPIMIIEADVSAFKNVFSNVQLGKSGEFYIISDSGQVVYSDQNDEIGELKLFPFDLPDELGVTAYEDVSGEKHYAIYQSARYAPWKVVGVVSQSDLSSGAGVILVLSLVTLALLTVIVWLVVSLMKRFYTVHEMLITSTGELEEKTVQLAQHRDKLTELNQLKDQILANTSHELKTPINGIIGITESLLEGVTGPLNETTKDNLRLIVHSGRRLSALVNDILDFSKMRAKSLELRLTDLDITGPVEQTISMLRPMLGRKPVQIIFYPPALDPQTRQIPLIRADENRLMQIFQNLLSNAIKFTDQGTITITCTAGNTQMTCIVEDTGIGIPGEKLPEIFDLFEQVDGSIERQYGGTGLGLAITKQLIELHDGSIEAESEYGKWTRFRFTLPLTSKPSV